MSRLSLVLTLVVFANLANAERPLPYFEAQDFSPYWESEAASPGRQKLSLPKFHLVDQRGVSFSNKNLEGKISLVHFFFARCGSVCPLLMRHMAEFKQRHTGFQILSISTQPEADTPGALLRYARAQKLETTDWSLLTGERTQIYALGQSVFQASRNGVESVSDTAFVHSSSVYLIDRELQLRGVYDSNSEPQMAALAKDIVQLSAKGNPALASDFKPAHKAIP